MLYEARASIASAQAYVLQTGLLQVSRAYFPVQNFLENKQADFLDEVGVKKEARFHPAVGGILLQHHLLFIFLMLWFDRQKDLWQGYKNAGNKTCRVLPTIMHSTTTLISLYVIALFCTCVVLVKSTLYIWFIKIKLASFVSFIQTFTQSNSSALVTPPVEYITHFVAKENDRSLIFVAFCEHYIQVPFSGGIWLCILMSSKFQYIYCRCLGQCTWIFSF